MSKELAQVEALKMLGSSYAAMLQTKAMAKSHEEQKVREEASDKMAQVIAQLERIAGIVTNEPPEKESSVIVKE